MRSFFFFFSNRIVSSKDHEWKEREREKKDSHTHAGEQQEEVLVLYCFWKAGTVRSSNYVRNIRIPLRRAAVRDDPRYNTIAAT